MHLDFTFKGPKSTRSCQRDGPSSHRRGGLPLPVTLRQGPWSSGRVLREKGLRWHWLFGKQPAAALCRVCVEDSPPIVTSLLLVWWLRWRLITCPWSHRAARLPQRAWETQFFSERKTGELEPRLGVQSQPPRGPPWPPTPSAAGPCGLCGVCGVFWAKDTWGDSITSHSAGETVKQRPQSAVAFPGKRRS